MTSTEIDALLDYHYWARDIALQAAAGLAGEQYTRELGSSFASVRDTLVHTYSAEWIWHERWRGASPTTHIPFERYADVPALGSAWTELEGQVRAFVRDAGDEGLQRLLPYTLLNGTAGSSVLWQMVQHVVNHASYHRGQVTTMIRQLGGTPPKSMDLITFYRGRK